MKTSLFLCIALCVPAGRAVHAQARPQTLVTSETNPNSPRRSLLGAQPSAEVRFSDVDRDGDPDILEHWWNGKRARWLDENDDMRATDARGDMSDDCVQIDRDGDGFFDGPGDMNVDWADNDKDGDADLVAVAMNPTATQTSVWSGEAHWMVFVDVDDDNVNAYVNWPSFAFDNWRFPNGANFSPDYNGNAIFLKEHRPPGFHADPRLTWENPFAFYDTDRDGCTEMAIRLLDDAIKNPGGEETGWTYDGKLDEAFVTFDLDNDAQRKNEFDYDLTLKFDARPVAEKNDYTRWVNRYPALKAPAWTLSYFRDTSWRTLEDLIYVPHERCFEELFKPVYGNAFLTFDEDDDDHRWERVELYYPGDPYSTARWKGGNREGAGLNGHPQSDTLGDRGEWDMDFSGKGRLYVGAWDGKIHLHGAEWGVWTVDEKAEFWGSWPVAGDSSPKAAPAVRAVVQYKDTDANGFFDEITYDYDGDKTVDLRVSLRDYADSANPHPDARPLLSPSVEGWNGMHQAYTRLVERSWQDALAVYRAAWKKGMTDTEMDDLAIAASTAERYNNAYWLRERIFRALDKRLAGQPRQRLLRRHHFLNETSSLVQLVNSLPSVPPAP